MYKLNFYIDLFDFNIYTFYTFAHLKRQFFITAFKNEKNISMINGFTIDQVENKSIGGLFNSDSLYRRLMLQIITS
jgi:hypothetical protein